MTPRLAMNTPDDDVVDNDDGWGDEKVDVTVSNPQILTNSEDPSLSSSSSSDESRISKNRKLERIQNEKAMEQSKPQFDTNNKNQSSSNKDLFIPIVTLVSIIGFTGLYGYEMIRLYSRGELYLPWLKN